MHWIDEWCFRGLTEQKAKEYLYQLLRGLEHLHRNGLFHRDVKPENILMKFPSIDRARLQRLKRVSWLIVLLMGDFKGPISVWNHQAGRFGVREGHLQRPPLYGVHFNSLVSLPRVSPLQRQLWPQNGRLGCRMRVFRNDYVSFENLNFYEIAYIYNVSVNITTHC